MSSLPVNARPHLELQLDFDHEGIKKDLNEIASHMFNWEEKLSLHFGLTFVNTSDIEEMHPNNPALQR